MNPTYWENQEVQVIAHTPIKRGDVVIFHPPTKTKNATMYLKRIIGLPGEHIAYREGQLFIDGEKISDPFESSTENFDLTESFGYQTIPKDSYFVLGDNRAISEDSRSFGVVHREYIEGIIAKE